MRKMLTWMSTEADETRWIFLCTALVGALAFPTGSAWAAKDARLTSVKGEASSSTGALESHAQLTDGDSLETGDESGCSILLDENAVVELCGQTRISFATDEKRGNRIVNIESGTVRMIVEPRADGERIEIHTPAAIATILGTVIVVTVDPVTGEATFTSAESRINIRERDDKDCTPIGLPAEAGTPPCAEGTTIGSLEQLTVVPGEKPREKKEISEQDLAVLGGCLFDYHELAAEVDRMAQANKVTQRVLAVDVASVDLPPISFGAPAFETLPDDPPDQPPLTPLDPFDPDDLPDDFDAFDAFGFGEVPGCPSGIPCDHGGF
jgi:hypothetical protein